tara:strand:- start:297 stop:500 length:204 start_codon:yes stop_codon:yes gene_type:complete
MSMDEEYAVVLGTIQDGIHRVVTGFETEDEAFEFLEVEGEDGFVIESETYYPDDDEYDDESYDEDAE